MIILKQLSNTIQIAALLIFAGFLTQEIGVNSFLSGFIVSLPVYRTVLDTCELIGQFREQKEKS
jgi:hypothetical protein